MQAFVLETLTGTGWRRSGETFWTFDTATAMAKLLLKKKQAQRVRVLPVEVSLDAVAEFPQPPELPTTAGTSWQAVVR